jgi:hypothetical protein
MLQLILLLTGLGTAASGETCLHGPDQSRFQAQRRHAALVAVRLVNTAEADAQKKGQKYLALSDLKQVTVPPDFALSLVTDGKSYMLLLRDSSDPCGFAFVSGDGGVIFEAQPLSPR